MFILTIGFCLKNTGMLSVQLTFVVNNIAVQKCLILRDFSHFFGVGIESIPEMFDE